MNLVRLSELVEPVQSCEPGTVFSAVFPYIDITAIDRSTKMILNPQSLSIHAPPSRARQLVKSGDILVSTVRPKLNAVAKVNGEHEMAIASTGFTVLRPRSELLDSSYLFRWVQTPKFVGEMVRQATGASYPAVSDAIVKSSRIPLVELAEQKRIAAILDKSDAIRRKREHAIKLGDEFLRSLFLDMFGDPVRNPKGWPKLELKTIADSRLGKMLDGKRQTGRYRRPYLRNANVQWNKIILDQVFEMDFDDDDREVFRLRCGDVLVCEGGRPGRAAIWRGEMKECYFQKALHRVRPHPEMLDPHFLLYSLMFLSERGGLKDFVTSATIAHLTGEKLKNIPLALPPLADQKRFAAQSEMISRLLEKLKEVQSLELSLSMALSKRAFSGELQYGGR